MKSFTPLMLLFLTLTTLAAGARDGRIRTIPYADKKVVRLAGCPNFQTMVRFDTGEKIENVGIGDAKQWLVTPNRRADILFVKPQSADAFSNMTVVTNRHSYDFELKTRSEEACARGDVVYDLRFSYPPPPPVNVPPEKAKAKPKSDLPEQRNSDYSYRGDKLLVPLRAFDDGHMTYLKWAKGIPVPAIYVIAADGSQTLANFTARGDYIVIAQIAMAFKLQRGKRKASLINNSFVVPELDAKSPKPAKEEKDDSFWPF